MKPIKRYHKILLGCLLPISLLMSGCSDSDDEAAMNSFTVKITNITNGQPLTPVAVVLHKTGYSAWSIGSPVSEGLEKLAEGGVTTDFVAEADADANVLATAVAGSAPFGPGSSASVDVSIAENSEALLTLATMLANTNDAFAGNTQVAVGEMSIGDTMTVYSHVHDAGTELNTESDGTMPGPADGGEGFNAARDDLHDIVTLHPGVVTADDGLTSSVLDESHRWLTVAARIDITRTE